MKFLSPCVLLFCLTVSANAQETHPVIPAAQTPTPQTKAEQATKPAETPPPNVSSTTYIIATGDTLDLSVWKEPAMSSPNVPVRPDGNISLALLGDVPAAGMTPMALGQNIALRLKKYVNEPLVTVTVASVRPKEVYLIGEVQKIGPVTLTPGMNTLQALSAGGGLTNFAKKKIYILRKGPAGDQKIPFDYKKAIKTGDQQGVTLLPGDTIVVP